MGKRPSLRELATKGNSLRLRELITSSYPPETWMKKFRRLDTIDQFRLWAATEPRELLVDSPSRFTLQIIGLSNKKPDAIEANCSSDIKSELPVGEQARQAHRPFPLALKRGSSSNFKEGS
jgi:hypothetical protein